MEIRKAKTDEQHLLAKYGFCRCGTIYLENGSPRIAYQLVV